MKIDPEIRFWAKVDRRSSEKECWNWTASCFPNGYGQFPFGGVNRTAHSVAYELTNGEVNTELNVLHTCDNRKCCNPSHLFLGTHSENSQDMWNKGRRKKIRSFTPRYVSGKYVVEIRVSGTRRKKYIGRFETHEEAEQAYWKAVKEMDKDENG